MKYHFGEILLVELYSDPDTSKHYIKVYYKEMGNDDSSELVPLKFKKCPGSDDHQSCSFSEFNRLFE